MDMKFKYLNDFERWQVGAREIAQPVKNRIDVSKSPEDTKPAKSAALPYARVSLTRSHISSS